MTIQFNSDNKLTVHENFKIKLTHELLKELKRYSEQLTLLKVHLSDEHGKENVLNNKRCLLEAHVKGRQSIVVTAGQSTHELAVKEASGKLKSVLEKVFSKMQRH